MGRKWFELEKPRDPELFESKKIITPGISDKNNYTYDENGYYCMDACYIMNLLPKFKEKYNEDQFLKYLTGILNSDALEFYLKQTSTHVRNKWYMYKKQYLEPLPIKLPQTKEEQTLASEITERVEKILSLAKVEQHVQGFPEPYFEELKEEIEEWDEISWRAKRSYKSIEPKVEEGAIVLGKGDGIKDPKINSEPKRKYVVEALKGKTISKDEEVKIKLPMSDAAVTKILKRLGEDKAILKEKPIAELEEEINEKVYRLYGLDENDVKVIEEFLEKF